MPRHSSPGSSRGFSVLALLLPRALVPRALVPLALMPLALEAQSSTLSLPRSLDGVSVDDSLPPNHRRSCDSQQNGVGAILCVTELRIADQTLRASILRLDRRVISVEFTLPRASVERLRDDFTEELREPPKATTSNVLPLRSRLGSTTTYTWRRDGAAASIMYDSAGTTAHVLVIRPARVMAVVGRPAVDTTNHPYMEFQVTRHVTLAPDSPAPAYPEELKKQGITGEVLVQFVVDTLGRAEPSTYHVLRATDARFEVEVQRILPSLRFIPAELNGRKVKQLVQEPFVFGISKD